MISSSNDCSAASKYTAHKPGVAARTNLAPPLVVGRQQPALRTHEAGPMCVLFAATHPELMSSLVLYGQRFTPIRMSQHR